MRAGRYRHRIEIWRSDDLKDPMGGVGVGKVLLATLWGSFEQAKGAEGFEGLRPVESIDARVLMRYRPEIEAGMWVRYRNEDYIIEAVFDRDGRAREMWLMVRRDNR